MLSNCGDREDSESPLDCKEIKPVNPKRNQPWIFIGRTDAEAPIPWPPDVKHWLIRKDPDAGKDWGQEEKGMTEDEMVGWHHWFNGDEFEQILGDSEGQGSLACFQSMQLQSGTRLSAWMIANVISSPYSDFLNYHKNVCCNYFDIFNQNLI